MSNESQTSPAQTTTPKTVGESSISTPSSNALNAVRLLAALALAGAPVTALAGPRTDLPSCAEARKILAEDSRGAVESWMKRICACERMAEALEEEDITQSDYDKQCKGASKTPPAKVATTPVEETKVEKPSKPEKPTKRRTTRTKGKGKAKKKGKGKETRKDTPEKIDEGATSPLEMPEYYYIYLILLFVLSREGFLWLRNRSIKQSMEDVETANEEYAATLGEIYKGGVGPAGGPPTYAHIVNKAKLRNAVRRNKELEERYEKLFEGQGQDNQ